MKMKKEDPSLPSSPPSLPFLNSSFFIISQRLASLTFTALTV